MLWFNHPRPVGSRKPVAMLVQQHIDPSAARLADNAPGTAAGTALGTAAGTAPGTAAGTALGTAAVDATIARGHAERAAVALQFSVRYTLAEYVSFMWQHGRYLIRRRRIGAVAGRYMLIKSTWAATCHFIVQRRARHTYHFTIDRHGIVRTGPGGVTLINWADVRAMRTYSRGRLLVLARGTLPIPARCLDRQQADHLAGCAAWIKAAQ